MVSAKAAALLMAAAAALIAGERTVAQGQSPNKNDLVGTWTLAAEDRRNAADAVVATTPAPRGLLVYDAAGHVVMVATRGGRPGNRGTQATPDEALANFNSFTGFFGTYDVAAGENAARIVHRVQGAINPNRMGAEETATSTIAGDRMVTTWPAGDGTVTRRTWERAPTIESMSAADHRLVGFWEWASEKRTTSAGAVISENHRDKSLIVYTPSGHVAVHFLPPARRRFAGDEPTANEARAALAGYVCYAGVFTTFPERGFVHHYLLATLQPAQAGDRFRRFFDIVGDDLNLRLPEAVINGQPTRTTVTLRKISGEAEFPPTRTARP